jgi:hypothetical protein
MSRKSLFYCLLACLTCLILVWIPSSLAQSTSLRPEIVAAQIYQQLPYLPKRNNYQRIETGEVNLDSTLVSRFIRYHQDIKKRSTEFRLDWQLTMADYLGYNEPIKLDHYPGYSTLQTNPMEADLKDIRSLNRPQRQEFIDIIVSIYSPPSQAKPDTASSPEPAVVQPSKPTLSKPGDARLLLQ